ncbi:SDR family NAD(P)-dependent oxidoreductase [Micromonospora soli]|uniref:SDR family NAD(P)-dependent oxidoreductase n=1 Tax=Micromonospora sp. NBRC 110009 TaxID=3061627 RepID=UPI0026724DE3|nr:SDR family NAD(P)-dependent oxidoreductase [Micromonospora sp. NBRC 110009]WKT99008.1 SDR family NAD(P)-dependent oxidoreductase [Micromonospora sp. NBRC 110009]
MPGRLQDTVALVTGASSGIGEATARSLAAEGAAVVVVARRRERIEELAGKIRTEGGAALAVEADITEQEQGIAAVERAVSELGRLDILVNNAGLGLLGPVLGTPTEEWDRMLAVNLQGLLYVTHAALPHLLRAAEDSPRRVADMVNISSTGGRVARPGQAVYSLTKFGVNAFSESLRQEVLRKRLRVSVIEPGTVSTEFASRSRDEVREQIDQQIAGLELLRPEDIAEAITFVVTRERRVSVNEILVRASDQTW